jgi:putative Holliday junction resolvase
MPPLLGLDYGQRRIGAAVSDESGTLATAVGTHRTPADGPFLAWLQRLIAARGVTGLVVGLPLGEAGEETPLAAKAREFARKLAAATGLPVALEDERYSSREAAAVLRAAGRRRRKEEVDALAAEIILQQHLDRRRGAPPGDPPGTGHPLGPADPPVPGDQPGPRDRLDLAAPPSSGVAGPPRRRP